MPDARLSARTECTETPTRMLARLAILPAPCAKAPRRKNAHSALKDSYWRKPNVPPAALMGNTSRMAYAQLAQTDARNATTPPLAQLVN